MTGIGRDYSGLSALPQRTTEPPPKRHPAYGKPPKMPKIDVGDVIKVGEPDYMFGAGDLVMRITKMPEGPHIKRAEWLRIAGKRVINNKDADDVCPLVRVDGIIVVSRATEKQPEAAK